MAKKTKQAVFTSVSRAIPDKMALIPSLNKDKKDISPAQKTFNRLTKQISRLKDQIGRIPERQECIRAFYEQEIHPVLMQVKEQELENMQLMSGWYERGNLTKKRIEILGGLMLDCAYYIQDRFGDDPAVTRTVEAFLERYQEAVTGISGEELKRQEIELMASMSKDVFDLDLDDLVDEAADLNDFMNKAGEKIHNRQRSAEFEGYAGSGTRKGTNASKVSSRQKLQEQLEQKSLRDIYIEMVRELHPDRAGSGPDQQLKEERMKELTQAYRDKDLFALLIMQMNWISESAQDFSGQPDTVLKQYNKIMQKQVQKLQEEYECFRYKTIPGLPAEYGSYLVASERNFHPCLYYEKKERERDLFNSRMMRKSLDSKQALNKSLDQYWQDQVELEAGSMFLDVFMKIDPGCRR